MEEHLAKNSVEHSQLVINAVRSNYSTKGDGGGANPMTNGTEESSKIKELYSPSCTVENLSKNVGDMWFGKVEDSKANKPKKGGIGVNEAFLKHEIEKCTKEIKGLTGDLNKKIASLESKWSEKEGKTQAMIAVLDRRTETFQQVLAVLSNELEAVHSKATALQKQNVYLKEFTEKQEKRLHSQDQMLTLKNIALAEQELRIQALEASSYDGVLLWRISEVRRRRQDAVAGKTTSFYSPVFYTSRHGYKLSARIYLNGDGLGKHTHMSLFFVVMRGRHDALLQWPFQQKVTFMLMNQNNRDHIVDAFRPDPASSSFKKPNSDMNIASGCPLFITQELLDSSDNYIRDDAMFIKVLVDTAGLEKLWSDSEHSGFWLTWTLSAMGTFDSGCPLFIMQETCKWQLHQRWRIVVHVIVDTAGLKRLFRMHEEYKYMYKQGCMAEILMILMYHLHVQNSNCFYVSELFFIKKN